jgi:hypothetical protein
MGCDTTTRYDTTIRSPGAHIRVHDTHRKTARTHTSRSDDPLERRRGPRCTRGMQCKYAARYIQMRRALGMNARACAVLIVWGWGQYADCATRACVRSKDLSGPICQMDLGVE